MSRPDPCAEYEARRRFGEAAHGVAQWPFGEAVAQMSRPATRPDGGVWPTIHILIAPGADADAQAATLASVRAQAYPEAVSTTWIAGPDGEAARATLLDDPDVDSLLILRAGDLLAPDALSALALQRVLTGADLVAGLRVVFDEGPLGLDAIAAPVGPLRDSRVPSGALAPFTGGEILLSRAIVARVGGLVGEAADVVADIWPRLAQVGAHLARVGRPVLLQHATGVVPPTPETGLSIVSLTDRGYSGGAGIAHRRLGDALALTGHRITEIALADESPPVAAEWTEHFPRTEAAIRAGRHDLVLAGNLHGATRLTTILDRIGRHVPVTAVLHDLFPLTGRCAFPGECALLAQGCDARCPTPTYYPQLAASRIEAIHAGKRAVLAGPTPPLLLANSAWTADFARTVTPPGTALAEIVLAFPSGVFRPGDRTALRRELDLPPHDILVMFAAVIADAPGKGSAELAATLRAVARPGVGFVAVGRLDDPAALRVPGLVSAGPIACEATLAKWYAACDVYVTASRDETLGQTPVEAGLCGTPTVAYRASGLTTAVIEGVSGLLVPTEPGALSAGLARLIADASLRRRLGAFARIALESRNSHAAAALRMNDVLVEHGLLAQKSGRNRVRFAPEMLARFACAARRHPGRSDTVAPLSPPLIRQARRAKQAVFGRGMPLWLRWALFAGSRIPTRRAGSR